jgi:hypothetical protein
MPTKKLLSIPILLSVLLAIGPARSDEGLQAGFAVRSIVPPAHLMSEVYSVVGGKHPTKVLDPIEARAVAISQGGQTLVVISVDLLGLFYDDVSLIREAIQAEESGAQVIVASSHTHSSIDTLGIYGESYAQTGVNDTYQAFVRSQAVDAAIMALEARQPAELKVARREAPVGYNEYDRNRHPGSFDDGVTALRFTSGGQVLGTLVNWASHPELIDPDRGSDPDIGSGEVVISSDYVHSLRETVEQDGGTAVFVNGPIGAVTALAMPIIDPSTSQPFPRRSVAKARHVGEVIGQTALDALTQDGVTVPDPELSIDSREFELRVDNQFILALRAAGTLQRQMYLAGLPAPFGNQVRTQMVRVELGPVEFLTTPGELQPDLYTGGYLPESEKANPDVPEERPVRAQMTGTYRFMIGLGQDELGYFVSATDYTFPSLWPVYSNGEDRNGVDHYQETLSLGRDTARTLSQITSQLLGLEPEPDYFAYPGGFLAADGSPWYGLPDGEVAGIWVDTSDSGRFERGEDAVAFAKAPSGGEGYGFLDSQSRDIGQSLSPAARGVWVDGDGDGSFDARKDPHLFFDTYALGEGEPQP